MSNIGGYTISSKPNNQDAVAEFSNESLQIKGVILSDGVGGMTASHLASKFIVDNFKRQLSHISVWPLDFNGIFLKCLTSLIDYSEVIKGTLEGYNPDTYLGATCIVGIESADNYIIAYIGNGSAWHIRGDFNNFNKNCTFFPWNAVNVLNPHSIQSPKTNRELLFRVFYPGAEATDVVPSVIQISKDKAPYGDMLVITTDGIYSEDQIRLAQWKGLVCKFIDSPMELLIKELEALISNKPLTSEITNNCLKNFLDKMMAQKMLDDDSSIGIILSDEMIEYHSRR